MKFGPENQLTELYLSQKRYDPESRRKKNQSVLTLKKYEYKLNQSYKLKEKQNQEAERDIQNLFQIIARQIYLNLLEAPKIKDALRKFEKQQYGFDFHVLARGQNNQVIMIYGPGKPEEYDIKKY